MALLDTGEFEGIGRCFFAREGFREPKKGEFYLIGAIVSAYRAPNDMTTKYQVVRPTFEAVQSMGWVKGDPITDPSKHRRAFLKVVRA